MNNSDPTYFLFFIMAEFFFVLMVVKVKSYINAYRMRDTKGTSTKSDGQTGSMVMSIMMGLGILVMYGMFVYLQIKPIT